VVRCLLQSARGETFQHRRGGQNWKVVLAEAVGPDGREGRVVGCVTYIDDPASEWHEWADGHEAQIRLLAVDAAARGKGVAEALVRECLRRAADAGRPVVLHTTAHMKAAQRLYERLGFRRVPTRDVYEYEEMGFLAYTWGPEGL
jgi:ribosomal protein S18 acetylase RimI-like enzyme